MEAHTKRKKIELSNRLQALVDMVTPGNRVVDVGCDHGFVSIRLVQQQISPYVLAMDVREGPLSRAEEHIAEYGLGSYIETRLSDGLCAYKKGEADTCICAGMGGRLMMRILKGSEDKAKAFSELILQPQSELPAFRRFLRDEGYQILDENILCEEEKYYFLFRVSPAIQTSSAVQVASADGEMPMSGMPLPEENELYEKYGRLLLQRKDAVLYQYLKGTLKTVEQIAGELRANPSERTNRRLEEVEREMADLHRALAYFDEKRD